MNLVLDEAEEVSLKRKSRKPLGELLCLFLSVSG
jgi:small nuclear ribonucleoprotein (snRNP)-like protein